LQAKTLVIKRKVVYKREDLEYYFLEFKNVIKKYNINIVNIHNMDEIGF